MKMTPERTERLKEIVKISGFSEQEFSDFLFEPPLKLADFYTGKEVRLPGYAKVILEGILHINITWLETGQGAAERPGIDYDKLEARQRTILENYNQMLPKYQRFFMKISFNYRRESERARWLQER